MIYTFKINTSISLTQSQEKLNSAQSTKLDLDDLWDIKDVDNDIYSRKYAAPFCSP